MSPFERELAKPALYFANQKLTRINQFGFSIRNLFRNNNILTVGERKLSLKGLPKFTWKDQPITITQIQLSVLTNDGLRNCDPRVTQYQTHHIAYDAENNSVF